MRNPLVASVVVIFGLTTFAVPGNGICSPSDYDESGRGNPDSFEWENGKESERPPTRQKDEERYLRLNIEIRPFGFKWRRIQYESGYLLGQGEQTVVEVPSFDFGITPGTDLGIGIAGSIGRRTTVGVRLLLGVSTSSPRWEQGGEKVAPDGEELDSTQDYKLTDSLFRYGVLPYLEKAFGDSWVRPFIMFVVGITGFVDTYNWYSSASNQFGSAEYSYTEKWIETRFAVGLGGGVHFFVRDEISIDLWLNELFAAGQIVEKDTASWRENRIQTDSEKETFKHRVIELRTDLYIGLSVWL